MHLSNMTILVEAIGKPFLTIVTNSLVVAVCVVVVVVRAVVVHIVVRIVVVRVVVVVLIKKNVYNVNLLRYH